MISSQHITTFKFSCFHLWPCSPAVHIGQSEAGPAHYWPIRSPETDSVLSPLLCPTSGGPRDSGEGGAGAPVSHVHCVPAQQRRRRPAANQRPVSRSRDQCGPIRGQYWPRSRRGETEPETEPSPPHPCVHGSSHLRRVNILSYKLKRENRIQCSIWVNCMLSVDPFPLLRQWSREMLWWTFLWQVNSFNVSA